MADRRETNNKPSSRSRTSALRPKTSSPNSKSSDKSRGKAVIIAHESGKPIARVGDASASDFGEKATAMFGGLASSAVDPRKRRAISAPFPVKSERLLSGITHRNMDRRSRGQPPVIGIPGLERRLTRNNVAEMTGTFDRADAWLSTKDHLERRVETYGQRQRGLGVPPDNTSKFRTLPGTVPPVCLLRATRNSRNRKLKLRMSKKKRRFP